LQVLRVVHIEISGEGAVELLRGQAGTTAAAHSDGAQVTVQLITKLDNRRTLSQTDVTLRVEDVTHQDPRLAFITLGDGKFIEIGNELMLISGIDGNDVTVVRAQAPPP
jgi:hypothetical protein